MTTDTYACDTIVTDYTGWPLTCIHCGSKRVFYSKYKNDCRCQACNQWQLNEEEE